MSEIGLILITAYSLAVFGILSSVASIVIIYRLKILHNAFGLISAVQGITDGSYLFFNTLLTFSIVLLNPAAASSLTVMISGLTGMFCNSAVTYLLLLKAINRSLAIIFPTQYSNIFTIKKTLLYLCLIFILCLLSSFLYLIDSCYLTLIPTNFMWTFPYDSNCTLKTGYIYFTWSRNILLVVTLVFDGITFFYLRMFQKRLIQHNKKMMTAEIRFFFQTFLMSIFYAIMLFSLKFLFQFATSPFLLFLIASANVLLFHATNEFFFIVFTLLINKGAKTPKNVTMIQVKPTARS